MRQPFKKTYQWRLMYEKKLFSQQMFLTLQIICNGRPFIGEGKGYSGVISNCCRWSTVVRETERRDSGIRGQQDSGAMRQSANSSVGGSEKEVKAASTKKVQIFPSFAAPHWRPAVPESKKWARQGGTQGLRVFNKNSDALWCSLFRIERDQWSSSVARI